MMTSRLIVFHVLFTPYVGWPKKASKLPTDLDESVVRDLGLELGFVDVKVAAIDETWSALKFVRRRASRNLSGAHSC